MKAKQKLLAFLAFWVVSIGICFYLNKQMIPANFDTEIENTKEVLFSPTDLFLENGYYTESIYKEDFTKISELYDTSDIVIKGIPRTKKQDSQIIQTKVDVIETLQGDVTSDEITVIEQATMIDDRRLQVNGSVLPMMYDKEYILFLKRNEDYASGTVYRLTSMLYGKFPTQEELKIYESEYPIIINDQTKGFSKDILNYHVVFFDLLDIELYENGTQSMDDDFTKMRYQSLIKYRDTFKQTYMGLYEELVEKDIIM